MTSLWEMAAVVVALFAWLEAAPTSLADAARHEAVRRQLMAKSAVTYTNDTLPYLRPSDISPPVEAAPAALSGEPAAATETRPGAVAVPGATFVPAAPPIPPEDDEKAWRSKLASLRDTLARDEALAASLQSRVSLLQSDFMARDDPGQRSLLGQDLAKALAELERTKAKTQADRTAIDKFRDDARRAGVPPGWVR